MWTCGICCQLAVMFADDGRAEAVVRVGRGSVAARRRPGGDVPRDDAPAGARPLKGRELDPSLAGHPPSRGGRDRDLAAAARRDTGCRRDDGAGVDGSPTRVRLRHRPNRIRPPARPARAPRAPRRRPRSRLPPATIRRSPATGASISTVALSVSTSTTGCPAATASPSVHEPAAHLRVLHRDGELRHDHRGHATRRSTAATTSAAPG